MSEGVQSTNMVTATSCFNRVVALVLISHEFVSCSYLNESTLGYIPNSILTVKDEYDIKNLLCLYSVWNSL